MALTPQALGLAPCSPWAFDKLPRLRGSQLGGSVAPQGTLATSRDFLGYHAWDGPLLGGGLGCCRTPPPPGARGSVHPK